MNGASDTETAQPTVRVCWYADSDLFARCVHALTHSPYDHVAVLLGGCLYQADSAGVHRLCGDGAIPGLRLAAATRLLMATTAGLAAAQAWAEARLGDPYSIAEDIGDAVHCDMSAPNAWNCSAFVAEVLVRAGLLNDADERSESPGSLYRALLSHEVSLA